MKRLTALFLALTLLCGCCAAGAEELPYIWQLQQNTYRNAAFLTPESYPRACLAPEGEFKLFSDYAKGQYIIFDPPAGVYATEFDVESALFINEAERIQYHYEAYDEYAYETFLNDCDDDDYIIYDGSGRRAAYIVPDNKVAYGLIGVPEISKSTKLGFSIYIDKVDPSVAAAVLTDAVKAEIDRLQNNLTVQTTSTFWSDGAYAGVKLLYTTFSDLMLVFDIPEITVSNHYGDEYDVRFFVTSIENNKVNLSALYNGGSSDHYSVSNAELRISFTTYNYAGRQKENHPNDVYSMTFDNDAPVDIYLSGMSDSGRTRNISCSILIGTDSNNQSYYLVIELDGAYWTTSESAIDTIKTIASHMHYVNPAEEVYVPSATPAPVVTPEPVVTPAPVVTPEPVVTPAPVVTPEPAVTPVVRYTDPTLTPAPEPTPEPAAKWICPTCQTENSGRFCSGCGAGKPAEGEWFCPNCKTGNRGYFCSNCGARKPEDGKWLCPNCGAENSGNYCSDCGGRKP